MKSWKFLLTLFIGLVLVKSLLASLVLAPSMFADEYVYAKTAWSLWENHNLLVDGVAQNSLPPLYSIVLAPAYAFPDMRTAYLAMKIINAIISSLVIFPAYWLAKELMSKKSALLAALLVGLMPATFSYSGYLMAENLFVPLVLLSAYLMHKYLTKESRTKYIALAGFALSFLLAYLTKAMAMIFLPTLFMLLLIAYLQTTKNRNGKTFLKATFLLLLTLIVAAIIFKLFGTFQYASYLIQLPNQPVLQIACNFLLLLSIYIGYLIVAGCFLPVLMVSKKPESKKEKTFYLMTGLLSLFSILAIIKLALSPSTSFLDTTVFSSLQGRVLGRYLDCILPLIVIGSIPLLGTKLNNWKGKALFTISLAGILLISSSTLLPVNNSSLSLLGAAKIAYEIIAGQISQLSTGFFIFTALIGLLIALAAKYIFKSNKNKVLILIVAIFVVTNTFNYAATAYNANTFWYSGEQMQLGLWINDNKEFRGKTFLIDERDEGKILKDKQDVLYEKDTATIIGFWLDNPIIIKNPENLKSIDYVISKHKLNLPFIRQTKGKIYLYKTR